jgi:hypothetical protein
MKLAWLVFVWLVACNGRSVLVSSGQPAPASSPATARPVPETHAPAPLTAPHGGRIELVAVTDRGDAALTADSFAEIRLWPTLDGTHEPVVVRGPRAMQLALGRDRAELFVAILDEAGGVELLRFDANGGLLGRAQLAAQPAIAQVVAISGGVLVRRADHSVERFDPRGVATGRLVPAAGQRVVSLAARRGRALAGISETDEPRARIARWIALEGSLAWRAAVELPEPLADLAIAPGGHRIAGLALDKDGKAEVGKIVELAPRPLVVGTVEFAPRRSFIPKSRRPEPRPTPIIGFVDDDDAVAGVVGQLAWASPNDANPWIVENNPTYTPEGEIAVGDRVVVARDATLQLADRLTDHFLGYRFLGDGMPSTANRFRDGGGVLLEASGGRLWLDSRLRAQPSTLEPRLHDLSLVLDEHHLLFTITGSYSPLTTRLVVRDITTHADTEIAVLDDAPVVQYDPGTHVLAAAVGENIVRYRLAFAPVAATPLRTLAHAGELQPFHLTDPSRAHGVVAVVDGDSVSTPPSVLVYRIDGDDQGPPVAPKLLALAGPITAVDRAGAIYVPLTKGMQVYRDGQLAERLALSGITAISHDGTRFASGYANEVIVSDAKGVERWRRPVWKAGPVAWSPDDRTLFVAEDGGATLSFDATTGERIAIRCGWGFGLYDRDVATSSNMPSACAAP